MLTFNYTNFSKSKGTVNVRRYNKEQRFQKAREAKLYLFNAVPHPGKLIK